MKKFSKNKFLFLAIIVVAGIVPLLITGNNSLVRLVNGEAKVLFVGDMFFDRHIRKMIGVHGEDYIFSCISDFLDGYDLVVGNLEGPITNYPSVSLGSMVGSPDNFVFTFPTGTAALLARHNIKLLNLGNNHIGNFGQEGIRSTHEYLQEARMEYFGGLRGDDTFLRKDIKGNKISFVSYNEFGGDSLGETLEKVKEEVAIGRKVVVYAHWGEEYTEPPARVRSAARQIVEAGAVAIIGSHPHVVLSNEKIGDSSVYYSLGNFIFDQYWDEAVRTGLALEIQIKDDQISFVEHPVEMFRDGRTCIIK